MKFRITNYRSQASSKNQGLESQTRPDSARAFVSLGFWIWDLFGIWGLVLGASRTGPCGTNLCPDGDCRY